MKQLYFNKLFIMYKTTDKNYKAPLSKRIRMTPSLAKYNISGVDIQKDT